MDAEASFCCICLKAGPVLYQITEKVNDDETLTPIYKLLICLPDINWLQSYKICNLCKDNLDETYDFREMCFKSEFSRCEIKTEDHKVEILDNDGFGNDLKIETKPPLENITTLRNVCNVCSNFRDSLSKISDKSNEENVSPILKLKILIQHINWSDDFDICNLCEDRLNKAFDFHDLCFKSQSNDSLAIESKQIKIEGTIDDDDHVEIESHKQPNLQKPLAITVDEVGVKKVLKNECHICSKRFLFANQLKKHLSLLHSNGSELKCGQCGKEFRAKQYLQRHLEIIHKVGVESLKNGCPLCSKRFSSPVELRKHLRLVHLNFKCKQCGRECTSRLILKKHLARVHKVEAEKTLKYECHLCTKRYFLPNELAKHLRAFHFNIYDFKCDHCVKEFKSRQHFKVHLANVHDIGVEETLKHKCHLCSRRFYLPRELAKHLRRVQCGKEFKWKEKLQSHLARIPPS